MRCKLMLTISLVFLLSAVSESTISFNNNVILRINGHDHELPDIITAEVQKRYLENKDSLEDSLSYRVVDGGTTLNQIFLNGGLSSVKMSPDPQDADIVNIDISICCNDANVDKQVVLWHF